jgi:hypothetical protein
MPPSEYDDGMEVPEPEFRPVPRRHCPADCSCREQLRAENERLRGWLNHIAYANCLSELLGDGPCEPGGECPGCAARAALLDAARKEAGNE